MNAKDLSNDADPVFLTEFYKNLKILSQDLYKKSSISLSSLDSAAGNQAGGGDNKPAAKNIQKFGSLRNLGQLKRSTGNAPGDNTSDTIGDRVDDGSSGSILESSIFQASEDYFSDEKMTERLKVYAKQGGIPNEYIERYAEYAKGRNAKGSSGTS